VGGELGFEPAPALTSQEIAQGQHDDAGGRRAPAPDPEPVLSAGGVRMDVERHEVRVDGEVVAMPLREFELLELFLRHPGRVLTRSQILERLWGPDYEGDTKTLDVHVKRLRGRIEADASKPVLITTVRGLGYRLDGDSEH